VAGRGRLPRRIARPSRHEEGDRRRRPLHPVIIWHLLSDPQARYHDLGSDFSDKRINPERKKRTHIHQLEALGYKVTLEPVA
jgi:hypothetical protein